MAAPGTATPLCLMPWSLSCHIWLVLHRPAGLGAGARTSCGTGMPSARSTAPFLLQNPPCPLLSALQRKRSPAPLLPSQTKHSSPAEAATAQQRQRSALAQDGPSSVSGNSSVEVRRMGDRVGSARGKRPKLHPGKGPLEARSSPTFRGKRSAAQGSQGPSASSPPGLPASISPPAPGPPRHGRAPAAAGQCPAARTGAAGAGLSPVPLAGSGGSDRALAPRCSRAFYLLVVVPFFFLVCVHACARLSPT